MTNPRAEFVAARDAYRLQVADHAADDPDEAVRRADRGGHPAVQLFLRDDGNTRENDPPEYERRRQDAIRWEDERVRVRQLGEARKTRLAELHAAYVAAAIAFAEAEADRPTTSEG